MHALLVTFGVAGDVHPFIAVGRALVGCGCRVTLASDEPVRPLADASGFSFISLGTADAPVSDRLRRDLSHRMRASLAYLRRVVIPRLPAMHATLDRFVARDRPDVIACHHTALCVPWIAAHRRVPWAMAAVAPASWTSVDQPNVYPGMPDRDRMPALITRVGVAVGSWATSRIVDPGLTEVRRELGLPPARRALFDEMFSGGANLGLWSPRLRPPASDDKPRSHVVGFPWFDAPAPDAGWRAEFERFAQQGPAPVLVTAGTSLPDVAPAFLLAAARACAAAGRPALVLAGRRELIPPGLPPDTLALPFAPLSEVLPRCAAAIHHGGLGTAARCLRSGVPMVCVPHVHDQFDNAARCRRSGASLTLDRDRADERRLAAALRRLLDEPSYHLSARSMAEHLAHEDGGPVAAQLLLGLVSGSRAKAQRPI